MVRQDRQLTTDPERTVPVAFNPPPFPTPDTVAATTDTAADEAAAAPDAFAAILLAAGGANSAAAEASVGTPGIVRSSDEISARSNGRIAKAPTLVISNGSASSKEPIRGADPSPTVSIEAETDAVLDPLAMVAALSAAIASTMNANTHSKTDSGTAVSGRTLAVVATAAPALSVIGASVRLQAPVEGASASTPMTNAVTESSTRTSSADAKALFAIADRDARFAASTESAAMTSIDPAPIPVVSASANEGRSALPTNAMSGDVSASAAARASHAHSVAHANVSDVVHAIETPVTAPGFAAEFAGKLAQVITVRNERAEFHLHPAELGPVDVKISFAADQAVVLITAAQPATRDALEQALPQLREMLAGQGIALGQATVQSGSHENARHESRNDMDAADPLRAEAPALTVRTVALRGLVDVFA